ncbi:YheC/YheD family protein [Paenibacillus sp. UMB7766-LJ446]|uniref:YheC/YheD family protein n=1 Tax=Paenibacillus sp. UMB7766-LJ446 TaxID=3046313 RepID=UPI00254B96E3|nr:YheC/YheD family protein [Paenibacillus sp. UMB7766-LJ446]MDK8194789.1 YheC/YheD family protein [Paenibacillus sp. UMB7766-LJ446]
MNSLPEERISELISEGMKKGAHVFLFDASHIDVEQEVIHGTFREGNSWVQRNVPLPDVVLNEAPEPGQNRPECEDWLRRRVPFTTFLIHGKYDIQKKLESLFKDYLIPTECLQDPDQFLAYLDVHGEVIDFRIHIQRDGTGRWALTKMYARIGNTDSIIRNISKGGRIEDVADLLYRLFPSQADRISREMERLAIRMAETINRSYSFLIDELGMDFIVTPEGRIYFVEANVSPPTPSHEQVRAARAIEYAHYVAKAGQLVPHPVIAMLTNDPNDKQLADACAYSAKWNNAAFYYFAPHDVHAELRYIKGYVLEDGEWEARYCPFPDVVYDRLKARGNTNYSDVYEALRHIPFTDERNEGSFSKKEVFEILQNYAELSSHLIPYTAVENGGEILAFIDTYGTSIIKPSIGPFGSGIIVVQREQEGFSVKTHELVHQMNGEEFGQLISMLAAQKGLIIQKFVRSETRKGLPYHIRLHLVRNGSGEWSFISAFPFLSTPSEYKVVNDAGSLRAFTTWDCLSRHEFPNKEEVMLMRLERMANMTADHIAGHVKERICELGIDVGIDSLGEIWIFEVNMNKIDSTHREFEVAQHMIPFALSLR